MDQRHAPALGLRYWIALCAASIFGANMGDYFAHDLGLGHIAGLPILAIALAFILAGERLDRAPREAYYWAAIVVIRTAATNCADFATIDFGLPRSRVIAVLTLALIVVVVIWYFARQRSTKTEILDADSGYWVSMFLAGTLGTVIGDYFSYNLHLGGVTSSFVLCAVLAVLFLIGARGLLWVLPFYWLTVVMIRAAGTVVGDYLAADDLLGLKASTLITGIIFVGILWLWKDAAKSIQKAAEQNLAE
jgi:uncharacterized membrane-anchored protein